MLVGGVLWAGGGWLCSGGIRVLVGGSWVGSGGVGVGLWGL